MDADNIRCGVVVHDRGENGEDTFADFVGWLRARPIALGGIYQQTQINPRGSNLMDVVDIQSGQRIRISQTLGAGSSSCCLDPAGLAHAAVALREARTRGVDLLVASKFAGSEADGEGLAPEIFAALAEGMPVLLLVSRRYRDKWLELSGGAGDLIPCSHAAMKQWYLGLGLETETDPAVGAT